MSTTVISRARKACAVTVASAMLMGLGVTAAQANAGAATRATVQASVPVAPVAPTEPGAAPSAQAAVPVWVAVALQVIARAGIATVNAMHKALRSGYPAFKEWFEKLPSPVKFAITSISGFELVNFYNYLKDFFQY